MSALETKAFDYLTVLYFRTIHKLRLVWIDRLLKFELFSVAMETMTQLTSTTEVLHNVVRARAHKNRTSLKLGLLVVHIELFIAICFISRILFSFGRNK